MLSLLALLVCGPSRARHIPNSAETILEYSAFMFKASSFGLHWQQQHSQLGSKQKECKLLNAWIQKQPLAPKILPLPQ